MPTTAIETTVRNLVTFRRSIRPHSIVAFLVEYLCFILDLLEQQKEVAKLFGVICAFDTLIFTLMDIKFKLRENNIKYQRQTSSGYCFYRFYYPNGQPYLFKFDAYLVTLSILHLLSTVISYIFNSTHLVLVPLILAGLELIPTEAYEVFLTTSEVTQNPISPNSDHIEAQRDHIIEVFPQNSSPPFQLLSFLSSELQHCQNQITQLRYVLMILYI